MIVSSPMKLRIKPSQPDMNPFDMDPPVRVTRIIRPRRTKMQYYTGPNRCASFARGTTSGIETDHADGPSNEGGEGRDAQWGTPPFPFSPLVSPVDTDNNEGHLYRDIHTQG